MATAIRVVGFVMITAFGKVGRVVFASDRRIDALAQVPRFRDLVVQISERVSQRWLRRIHSRQRERTVQWVLHSRIKSTGENHTSFRSLGTGVADSSAVFIPWMPSAAVTGRATVRPAAVDAGA